jgi:hypothetical protein
MPDPANRLYTSPSYPEHWIIHRRHGPWWLVPAIANGWRLRVELRAAVSLIPVDRARVLSVLRACGVHVAELAP